MTPAEAFAALGLAPGASPTEVRAAYRRLAKAAHPDAAEGSAEAFGALNRAYGAAFAYAHSEPCPRCAGRGSVPQPGAAYGWTPVYMPCGTCVGSGLRHGEK